MFKKLILKNFRNFEHIDIELKDKNVILGMNDVGKSNLLHALRMVFDKKIRLDEVHNTDFHNKNIAIPIEIIVSFDITEFLNNDIEKLRAKAREAITFEDSKIFYVKLIVKNTKEEGMLKQFFWGDNIKNLKEIKSKGINFLILDDVFSVIYIPSHVEIFKIFNEIRKEILKDFELSENDEELKRDIAIGFQDINNKIQKLTPVEKIEEEINNNLKFFDESYQVKVTSQSIVDDLYKQLKIYTIENENEHLYPASGDGRQKKIMYAMLHYFLEKEAKRKIPILILEEPENHLYLTAQIDLSRALFESKNINYIFCSSHSAEILYHISINCNLVRLYRKKNTTSKITISSSAKINEEYNVVKKMYAESLSKGYFADCVVLVEGYSEKLLCDTIFKLNFNRSELQRLYVIPVLGTNFKPYRDLLTKLGIKIIVRTDNDIYKNDIYGLKRCFKLINSEMKENVPEYLKGCKSESEEILNSKKIKLHEVFLPCIERFKLEHDIFLAEIDLENDLVNALKNAGVVSCFLNKNLIDLDELKTELQFKKWHNMFLFLNENEKLCALIYKDYRFDFLQRVRSCLN